MPNQMIKECLSILNMCGLNVTNKTKVSRIRVVFSTAVLVHMITELVLQITFKFNGWHSAESAMVCGAAVQALLKGASILSKTTRLTLFLEEIATFSSTSSFNAQFQLKMRNLSSTASKYIKIFFYGTIGTLGVFCLRPMFTSIRTLPFDTYHPNNRNEIYSYLLMYIWQIFQGSVTLIVAVGYDMLFISFIILLVFELKIVKQQFLEIKIRVEIKGDDDCCLEEVKTMIDHHNCVIACIKHLNAIYSSFLLIQFSSSVGFIFSAMLGMVASGIPPTLQDFFQYFSFLACALAQVFVYCLAGTFLISESHSVSEAVYKSDWWIKTQPKFRNACVLIIQRAHKTESLTAGGVFILNLETFTKIVRFGLSVFSLAQATSREP